MKVKVHNAQFKDVASYPYGAQVVHQCTLILDVQLYDVKEDELANGINEDNVEFGINLMFGNITARGRLGASEEQRMKVEDILNDELEKQDEIIRVLRLELESVSRQLDRLMQGG